MFASIRSKIILFYLAVLLVTLSVLGVSLYISLSKIVHHSIDSSLLSRAKALATLIHSDKDKREFNFSDEVIWEYSSPKSKHFFQIRQKDGISLEKSASLGKQELPFVKSDQETEFKTIALNGEPVRVITYFVPGENRQTATSQKYLRENKNPGLVIQCAEDIDERLDYLERYSLVLSISILSILVISASGGFFIARKALKPVKEISKTIDRISEANLSERIKVENIPTELKTLALSFNRTSNRLEQSFFRQKQFTADASHELRTPLSVILSQSEITLRRVRSIDDYQKALKAIHQVASHMSDIIRKLLTIARLGADKEILKLEPLPLNEIVKESVKLLTPAAEEKGIMLYNYFTDPVWISGDQALLVELFTNLIENAIKYNVPQGKVTITASQNLPWIVCSITDNGIGIPEEDRDKIFDRFYRVDKSRSKEIRGAGLGLSIVYEIIKRLGGKIEIKSKVNKGTTILVYFPQSYN